MRSHTILLSNDDGIKARGIRILRSVLESRLSGTESVIVTVAPDGERSAVSGAITLRDPLRMRQVGDRQWAVSGTPVDAVYVGLVHLMADRPPDWVISGINDGYNLGTDVFYSGTVAAAMEGALRNIRALAVSVYRGANREMMEQAAHLAMEVIERLENISLPPRTFFTLNLPMTLPVRGIKLAPMGFRRYVDDVIMRHDPKGVPYYWIGGPNTIDHDNLEGGERSVLDDGYAVLVPMRPDMTDYNLLRSLPF